MHLHRRHFNTSWLAAVASGALSPLARAAAYPEKPITFICPWPVGGTADQTMRALCAAAAKELGQAVAVENKVGAAGMIGLKAMTSNKSPSRSPGFPNWEA